MAVACVAVLVVQDRVEGPSVLVGRRREHPGDPWSGHWALPGGRVEPADGDLLDTALRELAEETGIVLSRAAVAGRLDPVVAGRSLSMRLPVQPFLFLLSEPPAGSLGDGELESFIWLPLADLERADLACEIVAPDGSRHPAIRMPEGALWGMTHRVLSSLWEGPLLPGIHRLVLDYDGTIYPEEWSLTRAVDDRITAYIAELSGISMVAADERRRELYRLHGNTLRGLMLEGGVDPHHFLDYVFDIADHHWPPPDRELEHLLASLGLPVSIFTNARSDYVVKGLRRIGIERFVERIFDIEHSSFLAKPDPATYAAVAATLAEDPRRIAMVEDRAENLQPARALGWRTVWIAEEGNPPPWVDFRLPSLRWLGMLLLPRLGSGA